MRVEEDLFVTIMGVLDGKAKDDAMAAFAALGLNEQLCEAAAALGWATPSPIQKEAIPHAVAGEKGAARSDVRECVVHSRLLRTIVTCLSEPQNTTIVPRTQGLHTHCSRRSRPRAPRECGRGDFRVGK